MRKGIFPYVKGGHRGLLKERRSSVEEDKLMLESHLCKV